MPTWIYGSTLCTTVHAGTWVYGETLCITIPSIAYPTLAWVRVTSLIHEFREGVYRLTMGLGDLTTEFAFPSKIEGMISSKPIPPEPPPPIPKDACIWAGEVYSEGAVRSEKMGDLTIYYRCKKGEWEMLPIVPPVY